LVITHLLDLCDHHIQFLVRVRKDESDNGVTKDPGIRIIRIECSFVSTLLDESEKSTSTHGVDEWLFYVSSHDKIRKDIRKMAVLKM
jgi:hypothetical protein